MSITHYPYSPWQPYQALQGDIPASLKQWLLDKGSLTEKLKASYDNHFQVNVLTQGWESPTLSESLFLGLAGQERASIREVLLVCGGKPTVFARSIMPESSLVEENQALLTLGSRSLGSFLFSHNNLQRGDIEIARVPASQFNTHLGDSYADESAWGRRSLFYLNHKPVSVCEIFLPDTVELQP